MIKKSNNLTGVTGEYYVCAELGKMGVLALLTPKNNPLFDIVAISSDASRSVAIQVKTMSVGNNLGWKLGTDICTPKGNDNLYVVLVNLDKDIIDYYIYEYDVLSKRIEELYKEYIKTPKRDGTMKKEVKFRWFDLKYFTDEDKKRKNNWEILGF